MIYAIPVFGIALVFMSDDVIEFDQTWIWLSIVLYIVAMGISHGVMFPTVKKMVALMKELNAMGPPPGAGGAPGGPPAGGPPPGAGGPPPQVAQMEALGQRLAAGGMALNLITVVIIVLMVWKPGAERPALQSTPAGEAASPAPDAGSLRSLNRSSCPTLHPAPSPDARCAPA